LFFISLQAKTQNIDVISTPFVTFYSNVFSGVAKTMAGHCNSASAGLFPLRNFYNKISRADDVDLWSSFGLSPNPNPVAKHFGVNFH
jgi:hypothetical protein